MAEKQIDVDITPPLEIISPHGHTNYQWFNPEATLHDVLIHGAFPRYHDWFDEPNQTCIAFCGCSTFELHEKVKDFPSNIVRFQIFDKLVVIKFNVSIADLNQTFLFAKMYEYDSPMYYNKLRNLGLCLINSAISIRSLCSWEETQTRDAVYVYDTICIGVEGEFRIPLPKEAACKVVSFLVGRTTIDNIK